MESAPMSYRHPHPYAYEHPPPPIPAHHYSHHPPPAGAFDPYYHHHLHHVPNPNPNPPIPIAPITGKSDIQTLFIAGIPDDIKAREIHNLFRRRPGFDSCLLEYTGRGNQVVAFATFSDHLSAVAAMSELHSTNQVPLYYRRSR